MTLLNPYTILFWATVSSQISVIANHYHHVLLATAMGVIVGTCSWILVLNIILHFTRHKLSTRMQHYLNIGGGCILLLFAAIGLTHVAINMI